LAAFYLGQTPVYKSAGFRVLGFWVQRFRVPFFALRATQGRQGFWV
jgi:hypothetical protein